MVSVHFSPVRQPGKNELTPFFPAVEMTPEQRRDAFRAILVAAQRQTGPDSEASELLTLTKGTAPVEASPAIDAEPTNGEAPEGRLPKGWRQLPLSGDDTVDDEIGEKWFQFLFPGSYFRRDRFGPVQNALITSLGRT